MKFKKSALMFLLAPCFMLACNTTDTKYDGGDKSDKILFNTNKAAALTLAENCDVLRADFLDALAVSVAESLYENRFKNGALGDGASPTGSVNEGGAAADHTDTNVQEEGVDEADLSETDGKYIYLIREDNGRRRPYWKEGKSSKVAVVSAWPAEETSLVTEIESPIKSDDGKRVFINHKGLYLVKDADGRGKRLVVVSSVHTSKILEDYPKLPEDIFVVDHNAKEDAAWTSVEVYNVEDPANPSLVSAKAFSGNYTQSRLIGNKLILVSDYNRFYDFFGKAYSYNYEGIDKIDEDKLISISYKEMRELVVKNAPIIRKQLDTLLKDFDSSMLLPSAAAYDASGEMQTASAYLTCKDVYRTESLTDFNGFMTVASIDIDGLADVRANAVIGDGWHMYASKNNVYIARSSDGWFWRCPENDCNKANSKIYKFNLDKGGVQYTAAGTVPGDIKDQFSFGETIDGENTYLKVASTEIEFNNSEVKDMWRPLKRSGTVSVLTENAGRLEVVGKVEGLGKEEGVNGEEIKAVRYIGDKGYVVTFERTDPLFVIDFSSIREPKKVGELKVPGFSSYIHPMSDNRLLTIGMDGTQEGLNRKMKLEIFNVSDPTAPTSESVVSFGETWSGGSPAAYDHHAFTYHAKSGFLAIPYSSFDFDYKSGARNIVGTLIFKVNGDANEGYTITKHGEVDHSEFFNGGSHYWFAGVLRNTMMFDGDANGYLYSLGTHGVKVNALDAELTQKASVTFPQAPDKE